MHHLTLIRRAGGEEEDDYAVAGILQLGGGCNMIGLFVKDLLADLVPVPGKRSGTRGGAGGAKDSTIYVPPLESIINERDGWFGKSYIPKVGEECKTSEDLAGCPSAIFVPFYLWILICTGVNVNKGVAGTRQEGHVENDPTAASDEGGSGHKEDVAADDEDDEIWTDQANSPLDAARKLGKMMTTLREDDLEMFNLYHEVAQNLLNFLWAANNNLTSGIRLRLTDGNLEVMRITRECLQEFLTFAEEGKITVWNSPQQADPHPAQESVAPLEEQQQPTTNEEEERAAEQEPRMLPPPPERGNL